MEVYDSPTERQELKAELKFVSMEYGEQFVMTIGTIQMPVLCAGN